MAGSLARPRRRTSAPWTSKATQPTSRCDHCRPLRRHARLWKGRGASGLASRVCPSKQSRHVRPGFSIAHSAVLHSTPRRTAARSPSASCLEPTPASLWPQVVGVGGGGSNAVNRMIQSDLKGVDFYILNTDAQARTLVKAACLLAPGTDAGSVTASLSSQYAPCRPWHRRLCPPSARSRLARS